MNWSNIKAIIFDFGGVLYPVNYEATIEAFAKLGLNASDSFFSKAKQSTVTDAYEKGEISTQAFYNEILRSLPTPSTPYEIEKAWTAILQGLNKDKLAFVQECRMKLPSYLLSNINEAQFRQIKHELGDTTIHDYFDGVYLSFEMGMRKPNANIFEHVMAHTAYKPEELFFIDDSPQHVEGAKKLGIKAYHLDTTTERVEDIIPLGELG